MKRFLDITLALCGLILASPVLLAVMVAIWLYDLASPVYLAPRVGQGGRVFRMLKFRSMVVNADRIGGTSTAEDDPRITPIGRLVRKYKLDELIQLWNVLKGDMSLVGPRPQVENGGVSMYTAEERRILDVRPGITDLASIVFADEGEILRGSEDPDLLYNQIIRPWKSRLALLYVDHRSFLTDLWIILLTAVGLVSRRTALRGVQRILERWGADEMVRAVARRDRPLIPYPPPGALEVVREYPRTVA